MSRPSYWLSASVLTITSAPSFSAGVEPGLEAGREALVVRQAHDVVDAVRARDLDRASVEPSSITSHSTVSKPSTSRGRSASVSGSVLLLVEAGDLDDELHAGGDRSTGFAERSSRLAPQYSMRRPDRTTSALAGVLLVALALRLWGIRRGCRSPTTPTRSATSSRRGRVLRREPEPALLPQPARLHLAAAPRLRVWFGGRDRRRARARERPGRASSRSRASSRRCSGRSAVWLLYLAGARLFDRARRPARGGDRGGRVPARLLRAPRAQRRADAGAGDAALLAHGAVLRARRAARDCALAGVAAGLAAATKYTGRDRARAAAERDPRAARAGRRGLAARRALALAASRWPPRSPASCSPTPTRCSTSPPSTPASRNSAPTRAATSSRSSGHAAQRDRSTTCGRSPGGSAGSRRSPRSAARCCSRCATARSRWCCCRRRCCSSLFMGLQGRYFGRWLLPILPIADPARGLSRRGARARAGAPGAAARAGGRGARRARAARQGLLAALHVDLVLARADTRARCARGCSRTSPPVARSWSSRSSRRLGLDSATRWRTLAHVAARPTSTTTPGPLPNGRTRYVKVDGLRAHAAPGAARRLRARGYCWVVIGSTAVRARVRRARAGAARARLLPRAGRRGAESCSALSPYATRRRSGRVQLRLGFDYYPRAYRRPGPGDDVYRLHGGRCATDRPWSGSAAYPPSCSAAHDRHRPPAPRPRDRARARGRGRVKPEPARRRRGRARRRGARRGLARRATAAPHAEVEAIARLPATPTSRGATLYVSLEPCCHEGKHAAVHRRDPRRPASRASSSPPTTRPRRPPAAGSGSCATRASRSCVADGELAAARAAAQPGVSQARAHRAPVGAVQVRDDARRQGRHPHRRLASGSPARRAASSRTTGAPRSTRSSSASAPRWPTTRS